ncbi:hypothetical protein ABAC460_00355 [Asticcacaulis sp. AC460]|uniref:hypothetical protein n=1 Tax=Asticcacaulis sp. AC460 TaxID=1282360 RepID=UPI0003C3E3FD|nr:hypothetical protein [Asticcacaulis sp. AC460]ESQ93553.1 hypothetical protein ABAC460_00355 [Asticcacaulis sp. AC460]
MSGPVFTHGAAIHRPQLQDYIGKYQPKEPDYVGKYASPMPKVLPVVQDALNRKWDVISLSGEAQALLQGKAGLQRISRGYAQGS